AEPFMKEAQEEVTVEGVELVLAMLGPHAREPVAKVAAVAVQEALALDEIDEHQPVQHHRGIPLAVGGLRNAGDELEKHCVLFLKTIVEALGDSLDVEPHTSTPSNFREGDPVLFLQAKRDACELLKQGIARLGPMEGVFPACGRLSEF